MEWTSKAISYLRFSSKKQERGDSIRRQTKATDDFCTRHALILDTTYSFKDLSISAYTGANLSGDLGSFLELLKVGKIPKGSTLIIEKLDRLSRQHPMQQLPLIDSILKAGVRIATTNPDRFYTDRDIQDNPYVVYEILSHAMSGYEESNKKSYRNRASWENKRKGAQSGKPMTSQCPGWLRVKEDRSGFEPLGDRVKTVHRIFEMADQGMGSPAIAKKLNEEGIPAFGGKIWLFAYITKLTRDRRVLGEHQSYHDKAKKTPVGDPLPCYYPQIISEDLFNRVQVGRQSRRKHKQGREESGLVNVFRGLLYDARTGESVGLFTYTDNRGHNKKKSARLIVRKGLDSGRGYDFSFRYSVLEESLFKFLKELNPADFSTAKAADSENLASLSSALTLVGEKIDITTGKMKAAKDGKTFSLHQDTLLGLNAEKERTKAGYDALRMRLSSPAVEGLSDTQTLIGLLESSEDKDALRLKIRVKLRQLLESIWILIYDEGGARNSVVQVVFPDDTTRVFQAGYSLTRKPYIYVDQGTHRFSTKSLAVDLRTIKDIPLDLNAYIEGPWFVKGTPLIKKLIINQTYWGPDPEGEIIPTISPEEEDSPQIWYERIIRGYKEEAKKKRRGKSKTKSSVPPDAIS